MLRPVDPIGAGFLNADHRRTPMHIGSLQLYQPPANAGPDFVREIFERARHAGAVDSLFLRHPVRSIATAGQWMWTLDDEFDLHYHVRHSALPAPGRVRELLELVSRLHSTRLGAERPMWEWHLIEGLADGRIAMYFKMHHALIDGVGSMRLLERSLSTDPEVTEMLPPFAKQPRPSPAPADGEAPSGPEALELVRFGLGVALDAAGLPSALVRSVLRGFRKQTGPISMGAPRTAINRQITGARRVAAQDWPLERLKTVAVAGDATLNDVVLAMVSGALRTYLDLLGELPHESLIAMVPVSLRTNSQGHTSFGGSGNAIGSIMVALGTQLAGPAERLHAVKTSMRDGKEGLASMTPFEVVAMSGIGQLMPQVQAALRIAGVAQPTYNLVISNVPGPRQPLYYDGAQLVGIYPLSIPIDGVGLNVTCMSYNGRLNFGLVGCRRTVPRLQTLLGHLEDELVALERATGVR